MTDTSPHATSDRPPRNGPLHTRQTSSARAIPATTRSWPSRPDWSPLVTPPLTSPACPRRHVPDSPGPPTTRQTVTDKPVLPASPHTDQPCLPDPDAPPPSFRPMSDLPRLPLPSLDRRTRPTLTNPDRHRHRHACPTRISPTPTTRSSSILARLTDPFPARPDRPPPDRPPPDRPPLARQISSHRSRSDESARPNPCQVDPNKQKEDPHDHWCFRFDAR